MIVAELIAELQKMPQDMEVFILDADEGCLLRLRDGDVVLDKGNRNYPFERVEIQAPYDDHIGGRRVEMTRW